LIINGLEVGVGASLADVALGYLVFEIETPPQYFAAFGLNTKRVLVVDVLLLF
jgi:hypothetical protein